MISRAELKVSTFPSTSNDVNLWTDAACVSVMSGAGTVETPSAHVKSSRSITWAMERPDLIAIFVVFRSTSFLFWHYSLYWQKLLTKFANERCRWTVFCAFCRKKTFGYDKDGDASLFDGGITAGSASDTGSTGPIDDLNPSDSAGGSTNSTPPKDKRSGVACDEEIKTEDCKSG